MTTKIYIFLPVHNRCLVTKRFIKCLAAQTYTSYHLILIDDGSNDGTAEMVRANIKNLTVLKGQGNWWWAGSLQQGIKWLEQNSSEDQDIVVFANDDITFSSDFLHRAVDILDGLKATLLLPHLQNNETGLIQETGVEADLKKQSFNTASSPDKINCLATRGLFMRVADLKRIGGFHTWLLPHYWSDYEFTIRAHKKGLKLCTSSDLVIHLDHKHTGYRSLEELGEKGLAQFLRQYFSKKSVFNPVYQSSFILLTGPWFSVPINVLRVWRGAFSHVTHRFIYSFKEQAK